jgi:DNA-binding PadR family transcriptional regulator
MVINALRRRRHARRRADEQAILRQLQHGGQAFGYDLGIEIGMRPARLYPALTRLLQAGEVEDGWEDAAVRLNPRRWYRITAAGIRAAEPAPTEDGDHG